LKKDAISKEIIKSIVQDISKYILRISIKEIEFLSTEKERIESRRADIVAKVDGKFILHLEIQNSNDKNMPYRMLRYWLDIKATTTLPIRQYVIYIGKQKLNISSSILEDGVHYSYTLIDIKQIDCNYLLDEDTPDSLVLAVLCDFKDKKPKDVIHYIIQRLAYHTQNKIEEFRKYLLMLEELSTNRDLLQVVKEEEAMLSEFDLTKLPSYEIGLERGEIEGEKRGLQRGLQKGLEQGLEEGLEQGKVIAYYELGININEIAKKVNLSKKHIEEILSEIKEK